MSGTRFPQLPVMGHVPKRRAADLSKTVTLAQVYAIIDATMNDIYCDPDACYALQLVREACRKAAVSGIKDTL